MKLVLISNMVNVLNSKKEFFRVSIVEIEMQVLKLESKAEFTKTAEAMASTEKMSIVNKLSSIANKNATVFDEFPTEI